MGRTVEEIAASKPEGVVLRLSDFGLDARGPARMIKETDLEKFAVAKQTEIRAEVDKLVKLGHKREHLILSQDGTVLMDREAVELDALRKFLD